MSEVSKIYNFKIYDLIQMIQKQKVVQVKNLQKKWYNRGKIKVKCECGALIQTMPNHSHLRAHQKTKKHYKLMNLLKSGAI